MSVAVKLSEEFVEDATVYAREHHRSLQEQIEHWWKVSKIARDNPDLPHEFIEGILISMEESARGEVSEFRFGEYDDKNSDN